MCHSSVYAVFWTKKKLNLLNKQCLYWNSMQYQKLQNADFPPWHISTIIFATHLLSCRWYVVQSQPRPLQFQVCQVATAVMETTQLVLANLKTFYCSHLIIEQDLSLPKIISKCELLELCHINHRGQVFFEAQCRHKQMDSEGWHPGWAKRVLLHPGIPSSNCTFDWTFLTT